MLGMYSDQQILLIHLLFQWLRNPVGSGRLFPPKPQEKIDFIFYQQVYLVNNIKNSVKLL